MGVLAYLRELRLYWYALYITSVLVNFHVCFWATTYLIGYLFLVAFTVAKIMCRPKACKMKRAKERERQTNLEHYPNLNFEMAIVNYCPKLYHPSMFSLY